MVGWVSGAGRLGGIDAGPEGGARFKAGPPGTSGTAAGGTGGGLSENIWAELGPGSSETSVSIKATASAGKGHPARPYPLIPLPLEVMGMLFTENAANSSLQHCHRARPVEEPVGTPDVNPAVVVQSQSLPRPLSLGINHAWRMLQAILAGPRRGEYLQAAGEF